MKKTDDVLMRCTKNKSNMKISEMTPGQNQIVQKSKLVQALVPITLAGDIAALLKIPCCNIKFSARS